MPHGPHIFCKRKARHRSIHDDVQPRVVPDLLIEDLGEVRLGSPACQEDIQVFPEVRRRSLQGTPDLVVGFAVL